jgi:hypothetical protein
MDDPVGRELRFLAEVAEDRLREHWANLEIAERRKRDADLIQSEGQLPEKLADDVSRTFAQPVPQKRRRWGW